MKKVEIEFLISYILNVQKLILEKINLIILFDFK